MELPGRFTIEVLLKPFRSQGGYAAIVGNHHDLHGTRGFVIQQAGNEGNMYSFGYGTGASWVSSEKFVLVPDRWHYLVGTVDDRTLTVFVDGLDVASRGVSEPIRNSDLSVSLGNWWAGDRRFNGIISEARILNNTIDQNEVQRTVSAIRVTLR
jgi:hypothetical protein